jgi:hypothetical protein
MMVDSRVGRGTRRVFRPKRDLPDFHLIFQVPRNYWLYHRDEWRGRMNRVFTLPGDNAGAVAGFRRSC